MNKIGIIFFIGILLLFNLNSISSSIEFTSSSSNYDMIIITPEKFVSNLQPLVNHKNSYGINTLIKNVEGIYEEYEGRDKAEQI
ncbi:unnamed protein product, partial [marine sediment metagenome]